MFWITYSWRTAVQMHLIFIGLTAAFLAVAAVRGASPARMLWAWFLAASGVIVAIVVGIGHGLLMRYGVGVTMLYFAGELRPLALYGPWISSGTDPARGKVLGGVRASAAVANA